MKLTKTLEAEIKKVMEDYWASYFKGDLDHWANYLVDDYKNIGGTEEEIWNSKKEILDYTHRVIDQMKGVTDLRNKQTQIIPFDPYIMVHELLDVYIKVEDEWSFYQKFRLSSLIQKTPAGWKVFHQHGSYPDSKTTEGEAIAFDTLKNENKKLQKAVQERTIELEDKNRELEIETALEKVRAIAMGMKQPDDMLEVCKTISGQLQQLGVKEIRNVQTAIINENKNTYFNYEYYSKHHKLLITEVDYKNHTIQKKFAVQMLTGAEELFTEILKGKKLKDWYAYQQTTNQFADRYLEEAESLNYYWYSLGPVALGMSTYASLNNEEIELFKRFRNVFELAYRRFLDIEKAMAQSREAQTELALERVRAKTMAMQHSNDLASTASVLFQQIKGLGFNTWSCGFCTWQQNDHAEVWMGADSGGVLPPMMIPYKREPTHHDIYKASLTGADAYEKIWEGKQLTKHYDFLRGIPSVAAAIKQLEDGGLELPIRQCYYVGFFKQGYLLLITTKPNKEMQDITKRFAKVFEQAYTRFLDLQKAEAQAREAQIEVAVERVRAQSMAMHQTTDLDKVNKELLSQLQWLAVDGLTGVSLYFLEDDGETTVWDLSSPGNISDPVSYAFKFNSKKYPVLGQLWQLYNNSPGYFTIDYPLEKLKKALTEFRKIDNRIANVVEEAIISGNLKHQWNAFGKVTGGVIGIDLLSPPSEDTKVIVTKMAGAFNLAYKRFLDLQKSEGQAREAEIELGLERVRARTMAMQHSDELADASLLLDQQIRGLGIKTRGCAFNIYGEKESTEWFSNEMGTMQTYKTPREKVFLDYYDAGQKGETLLIKEFSGNACVDWYNYLCTLPVIGDGLKEMIVNGGTFPTRQIDHVSFFKYGYLLFLTFEPVPEAHDIFIRFAKVFEQTYTRFLDLQKAEAQALRAEQDVLEIKKARQKAEEALVNLQAAQKQLVQSEKMASLGELTAGIAHEIQNPLNFVNNFSELSKELLDEMKAAFENGDTADAMDIAGDVMANLEKINHHGKRADAIVKGMLQHSQSSTGKKELTNINALCDEYLRLSYHGLRSKDNSFNATIKTDFDESVGYIHIIPQDIGRVLLNFFNNAFYAISDKYKSCQGPVPIKSGELVEAGLKYEPVVSISTKKIGNNLEIKATDNGNGIPTNIIDKIFQPFFTTKPTGQGTGLGLSLSYDIIKAHAGEIKVESKENEGTTFIIQLPIV